MRVRVGVSTAPGDHTLCTDRIDPAVASNAVRKILTEYDIKTREILGSFTDMDLPVGDGNVIFSEGNALKYLAKYFKGEFLKNPYARTRVT